MARITRTLPELTMWLTSWLYKATTSNSKRRARPAVRCRPEFETLEVRLVPTPNVAAFVPVGAKAPQAVAIADLDGDGRKDIITGNAGNDGGAPMEGPTISVLLGRSGKSTSFQPAATYSVSFRPNSIVVGDFNGDNKPDV